MKKERGLLIALSSVAITGPGKKMEEEKKTVIFKNQKREGE